VAGVGGFRGWPGRYRAWRGRSISNQVTAAAVTIALAVAAVFGITAYVAVSVLVSRGVSAGLEGQAQLVEQKLLLDVELTARDLEDLSENSFIANGLVDSHGRDTYLLPFLREHKVPTTAATALVLCDFRGVPIASNVEVPAGLFETVRGPREVLATLRPHAEVARHRDTVAIAVSQPVVFPPTAQVEGVMMVLLDVPRLLEAATAWLAPDTVATLTVNEIAVGGPRAASPQVAEVTRRLALSGPFSGIEVELQLARREPGSVIGWIGFAFLAIAVTTALVVFFGASAMARRLTSPIEALSRAAERVSVGSPVAITEGVGRSDEVGTLARTISGMLAKLRVSHEELERRVDELRRREAELERYSRTQAVLLQEVNHRVKNNLSAIIGLLSVEEAKASNRSDEVVTRVLGEMERRIRSLDTVHSLLSRVEWRPLPLHDLCGRLLQTTLGTATGVEPSVRVEESPVLVDSAQAHALALVLNELATNTLKYGRSDDGRADVELAIAAEGEEIALTYRDRGCGFPGAVVALEPSSLGTGLNLVRGIVEGDLGGSLRLASDRGAVAVLRFGRVVSQGLGDSP